jgi:hypothetical protein
VVFVPRGDDISSGWGRVGIRVGTCLRTAWGRYFFRVGTMGGDRKERLTKSIWRGVLWHTLGMPSMPGYPTKLSSPRGSQGIQPRAVKVRFRVGTRLSCVARPCTAGSVTWELRTSQQCSTRLRRCVAAGHDRPSNRRRLGLMGLYRERRGQARTRMTDQASPRRHISASTCALASSPARFAVGTAGDHSVA